MNKVIILLILTSCMLMSNYGNAQTLTFSRVLLVNSNQDTVPTGKVWKIVSYFQDITNTTNTVESGACALVTRHHPFYINDTQIFNFYDMSTGGGLVMTATPQFPIWVPEGAFVRTECPKDYLSIIEFETTP